MEIIATEMLHMPAVTWKGGQIR